MNSVTTTKAREKFAKAHIGDEPLPAITQVAWGDGGHDPATGAATPPDANSNVLGGEFLRKAIDAHSFPTTTTLRMTVSLQLTEGNGENVSACALVDADGDLVAVKHFTPKGKDNETVIEIDWDEEF